MAVIAWEALLFTLFPLVGGLLGSWITRKNIKTWYDTDKLKKPNWRPPNWLFGPVWTALYLAMGYASYLVWKDGDGWEGRAKIPLIIFGAQLLLNWAWSFIFFGAKKITLAFYDIIGMDIGIAGCIITFLPINATAGYLMAPYMVWVAFASFLNYKIVCMNDKPAKGSKRNKSA